MKNFVSQSNLTAVLTKIKAWVEAKISALSAVYAAKVHNHTMSEISDLADATTEKHGLMSVNDKQKLDGVAVGAQVNVIEKVKVNGVELTPADKAVDVNVPTKVSQLSNDSNYQQNVIETVKVNNVALNITDKSVNISVPTKVGDLTNDAGYQVNAIEQVKVNGNVLTATEKAVNITVPTKVSDITNDSEYQTKSEVESAIATAVSSAYKVGQSLTAAELVSSLLVAANLGKVYNIKEQFTTDANFVEGADKTYPIGTNVAVVEVDGVYKFDVQAGFIDTAGLETSEMSAEDIESAWSSVFGVA